MASAFIADATESCDKGFAAVVDEFKMLDYYPTHLSSIGVYKLHITIDCRLCTHIAPFNKSSTQTVHMHRHARTQKDTPHPLYTHIIMLLETITNPYLLHPIPFLFFYCLSPSLCLLLSIVSSMRTLIWCYAHTHTLWFLLSLMELLVGWRVKWFHAIMFRFSRPCEAVS